LTDLGPLPDAPDDAEGDDFVIEVEGLRSQFGDHVVHEDLNLNVRRGEVVAVVGGSGSGKSVLLNSIIGLKVPEGGTVKVFGQDVSRGRETGGLEKSAVGAFCFSTARCSPI